MEIPLCLSYLHPTPSKGHTILHISIENNWKEDGGEKPNSFMSNPLGADVSEKNTQTFLSCTPVFSYK